MAGTYAASINKRGDIVGVCGLHGFRRRNNGQYKLLDAPGAVFTYFSGINDDGDIVGSYQDIYPVYHGVHWEEANGQFSTIDVPFPEATTTELTGVNNVGQIVGTYFVGPLFGYNHGFLYDNGVFTRIDFPDALATLPFHINDQGQIVGLYNDSAGNHGFLLDSSGTFTTIDGPFPGVTLTEAYGINNRGQIVGRVSSFNLGDHGFIATPNQSSPLVTSSLSQPGVKK